MNDLNHLRKISEQTDISDKSNWYNFVGADRPDFTVPHAFYKKKTIINH